MSDDVSKTEAEDKAAQQNSAQEAGAQDAQDANVVAFKPNSDSEPLDANAQEQIRMLEAIIFASSDPVSEKALKERLPEDADLKLLLEELQKLYASRGVNLVKIGKNWAFRTADDLGFILQKETVDVKKLSRAALEVLATISYHQPVTRAEIEEIRGVATSKGTLDVLMETEWVKMRGRRKTPGRPVTYGTTDQFLDHFGLEELKDLPGLEELKGAGMLQSQLPANFKVPQPYDSDELTEDEEPLSVEDVEDLGLLTPLGEEE
ncbi:MAG: SMC-Scp complex subunit ScpB [Nitratireductor sp.]